MMVVALIGLAIVCFILAYAIQRTERRLKDIKNKLDDLWYWRMNQCPKPLLHKD